MSAPPLILAVEDNDDDAFVIQKTFKKAAVLNRLRVLSTGEQAIAYFKGDAPFADRSLHPLPKLLLLDLKLPGIDGFEVMRWLRQQPQFAALRIVVVTSSTDARDLSRAFDCGANSFLIKPVDFVRLAQFSEAISGCWVWVDQPDAPPPDAPAHLAA